MSGYREDAGPNQRGQGSRILFSRPEGSVSEGRWFYLRRLSLTSPSYFSVLGCHHAIAVSLVSSVCLFGVGKCENGDGNEPRRRHGGRGSISLHTGGFGGGILGVLLHPLLGAEERTGTSHRPAGWAPALARQAWTGCVQYPRQDLRSHLQVYYALPLSLSLFACVRVSVMVIPGLWEVGSFF